VQLATAIAVAVVALGVGAGGATVVQRYVITAHVALSCDRTPPQAAEMHRFESGTPIPHTGQRGF
jgi:hypothetical protein